MPPGKDIITNRYSNRENGWCSNKKNYPAEALETLVGQSFADTLQYETWVEFVNKTYERQIEDLRKLHRSDPHKTKESLVKRIGALEKKISRARELFINGDLPRPEYVDKKFGIQDKIEVVRQELSKLGDFDSAMERLELQRNLLMALAPTRLVNPRYISTVILMTLTLRLSSMTTLCSPTVVERLAVLCLMVAREEPRSIDKSSIGRWTYRSASGEI
jgi:hypothetical protein